MQKSSHLSPYEMSVFPPLYRNSTHNTNIVSLISDIYVEDLRGEMCELSATGNLKVLCASRAVFKPLSGNPTEEFQKNTKGPSFQNVHPCFRARPAGFKIVRVTWLLIRTPRSTQNFENFPFKNFFGSIRNLAPWIYHQSSQWSESHVFS